MATRSIQIRDLEAQIDEDRELLSSSSAQIEEKDQLIIELEEQVIKMKEKEARGESLVYVECMFMTLNHSSFLLKGAQNRDFLNEKSKNFILIGHAKSLFFYVNLFKQSFPLFMIDNGRIRTQHLWRRSVGDRATNW